MIKRKISNDHKDIDLQKAMVDINEYIMRNLYMQIIFEESKTDQKIYNRLQSEDISIQSLDFPEEL